VYKLGFLKKLKFEFVGARYGQHTGGSQPENLTSALDSVQAWISEKA